jgi:hypothetical protein
MFSILAYGTMKQADDLMFALPVSQDANYIYGN